MYNMGGSVRIPVTVPNRMLPPQLCKPQVPRLQAALYFTVSGPGFFKTQWKLSLGKNNITTNKSSHTLTIKV